MFSETFVPSIFSYKHRLLHLSVLFFIVPYWYRSVLLQIFLKKSNKKLFFSRKINGLKKSLKIELFSKKEIFLKRKSQKINFYSNQLFFYKNHRKVELSSKNDLIFLKLNLFQVITK